MMRYIAIKSRDYSHGYTVLDTVTDETTGWFRLKAQAQTTANNCNLLEPVI